MDKSNPQEAEEGASPLDTHFITMFRDVVLLFKVEQNLYEFESTVGRTLKTNAKWYDLDTLWSQMRMTGGTVQSSSYIVSVTSLGASGLYYTLYAVQ